MNFSRQFKALGRIAVAFACAWAVIGGIVALITGPSDPDGGLLGWVLTHMFMYAALGAISGLVTAVLVARAEAGRQVAHLVTSRFVVWGVVGGLAPVALFGVLGAAFGASTEALVALAALGVVSAGLGGAVAASSAAVAKRGEIAVPPSPPRFPAT
jgi:hypothetical protein